MQEPLALAGIRKIIPDMGFQITWDELINEPSFSYTDLCYTAAKEKQLTRIYWNQEGFDAAIEKLSGRKTQDHSSVAVQMRGEKKDSRSQGHCMQSLVITMTPDRCTVDIYYRSTEVIQKFAADLIFFKNKLQPVFEAIGRKPSIIRMRFANLYISAMFMPIFLRYEGDPIEFFEHLLLHDARFHRTCGLTTRVFFRSTHNYSYRTRIKMFEYWKAHINEKTPKMQKLGRSLMALKGEVLETGDDE